MALHYLAETAFDDLLTAWRHHGDLKAAPEATIAQVGRARLQLEDARERMHRLRSALYPNPEEIEAIVATALCPTLDEVVHLGWSHRDQRRPGNLQCPCGELVPLP